MRAMIAAELRGRWPRTIALAAGLVLSAGSFALFSATAKTEQLQVHGTVARVFRSSYDLLVRPARSSTPIERSEGLVRDNFLSGIFGGITMDQYRQIAQLPGVAVAAPIAMIGYVLQPVEFHVDLTRFLHGRRHALFAVRVQRTTDAGHVHLLDQTGYVYVTRNPLTTPALSTGANEQESLPGGHVAHVCPINGLNHVSSPFGTGERGIVDCWSLVTGADANGLGWAYSGFRRGHVGATIDWPYPLLLAAIDPTAEARLVGLSRAIVSGRYLRNGDVPTVVSYANGGRLDLPVLVSSRPYGDDTDTVTVRAYGAATTRAMLHASTVRAAARVTAGPQAPVLVRRTFGVAQAYANLLRTVTHQQYAAIDSYWSASPTRYRQLGVRELTPIPTRTPHRTWRSDWMGTGYVDAPIDASMTGFRRLHAYPAILPQTNAVNYPVLHAVGHFDPARLPGFSSLSRLPQETYYPPTAAPADARTRALLHGRDLLPDANPAGYLQPPPLLLTDLNSLPAFSDPSVFPTADASAPISVIRVRVADVHGDDPVSRERVRLAAQRIVQATGLQVDVTIGSSPTPVRIDLPGGSGRPALTLSEGWIKKGVSVSILDAIDRQSQILFALILLVGAVFTANAVSAAVRVRRAELGVLAAVGWDRRHLFGLLMGELAVLSLGAGVTGGLLALGLGAALQDRWDPATAALAVPAAMAIALLAGIGPALRASWGSPLAAVAPPVLELGRARQPRRIAGLSTLNVVRSPGRSLLGALSLAIGVCAVTVFVGATVTFRNHLVGTVLGNAISVQSSASDWAALAIIVVLALAGLADVIYLNQRERLPELATLQATGWGDGDLRRLIAAEGAWIAAVGSLTGAAGGLLITSGLNGGVPVSLAWVTATAAVLGLVAGIGAALIPTAALGRRTVTGLLATE